MVQIIAKYDKKCHRSQNFSISALFGDPTSLILTISSLSALGVRLSTPFNSSFQIICDILMGKD